MIITVSVDHIQIQGEGDVFIIKEEQSSSMPSKCTSSHGSAASVSALDQHSPSSSSSSTKSSSISSAHG